MHEYRVLIDSEEFAGLYRRMKEERLLWAMFPECDEGIWDERMAVAYFERPEVLTLGGYADGELAGFMTLVPTRLVGRCCEVGLLAFRDFFHEAIPLCRGALKWALENQNIDSLVGYIPKPSRHSMRLIERVGFRALGEIPGFTWYTKLQKFVPSIVVVATRAELEEVCNGWRSELSGSGSGGTDSGEAADKGVERRGASCNRCAEGACEEEPGSCECNLADTEPGRADVDYGR